MNAARETLSQPMRGNTADAVLASCAINILSLALPITLLQVYDRVIPNSASSTLAIFFIVLGILLVFEFVLSLCRAYITSWNAARQQHKIACDAVSTLFRSDLRAYDSTPPGIHIQRLRAIDSIKNFAGQRLLLTVELFFAFLFLLLIGLIAGSLVVAPLIVIAFLAVAALLAGRKVRGAIESRKGIDDRRYSILIEVLRKIQTVKGLGLEAMMMRRYEELQGHSAEASYRVAHSNARGRNIGHALSQFTAISVGAYGATLVIDGALTIGGLAACTLLASRSVQPLMRAFNTWTNYQSAQVTRRQVGDLLAMPMESKPEAPAIPPIEGNVDLENITFSYTNEHKDIFRGVSLRLESGDCIAICGANGSGKSTILGLIMGLLVPNAGSVLIDGRDAGDHDAVSLRSQVVYLPQRPELFQGTLLDNLTMFRGDAYLDRALYLAERLGLHAALGEMPRGYETRVEHAANDGLPGGIRQRIALVRALALVDEPRLILFDEANTFLDQESDRKLLDLLKEYRGRCTMVIVSHRPSYLALADRTYIIRDRHLTEAPEGVRRSLDELERAFA